MRKILILVVIGILIASTIAVANIQIDVSVEMNEEENVFENLQDDNSDCGCSSRYQTTSVGGYGVMTYLPPLTEEDLLKKDNDPQPTGSFDDIPEYFSWKDFGGDWSTPVRDQQSCGSCWAFSALGAMEPAINIASGFPNTDIDLSEQYVLSCLSAAGSCSGGWMHEALDYIYSTDPGPYGNSLNGVTIEQCMPYQAVDYIPCEDKECTDWDYVAEPPAADGKFWPIESWGWTTFSEDDPNDWDTMKTWIMDRGPLSVDIFASSGFQSYWGSHHDPNDVYEQDDSGTTNHGVVLLGWKDDINVVGGGYWIFKNSWGPGFGYGGFFNVAYGCLGVATRDCSWVITEDWPQAEKPDPSNPDPRVIAGWDYESKYPKLGDEIEFTDESRGNVALYQWDFDGDGVIDVEGMNAKRPKWTYYEEGDYDVTHTVWSSAGLSSTLTKVVGVYEIWPPTAVVTPSYYGGKNNVIRFEGRFSYDVDGNIAGYAWDLDGDGNIDSTEGNPEYTYPNQNGEYTVTLTVTDNEGATGIKEVEVKIDKTMPPETIAIPGGIGGNEDRWFPGNVKVDLMTTDWSGVSKLYFMVDGDEFADSWVDGIYCYGEREYIYDTLTVRGHGVHTVEFYAVDVYGNIESNKSEQIKIDTVPPTLDIEINGNTVTLTASDADSGVALVKYYLDGIEYTYTGPFTIPQSGSHNLLVIVEDVAGNIYSEEAIITIEPAPSKPSISGPSSGQSGMPYSFDFESTDPKGNDVSYFIDWGDQTSTGWTNYVSSGTTITETHTWSGGGTYTIQAKAKNTLGAESDWGTKPIAMPNSENILVNPQPGYLYASFTGANGRHIFFFGDLVLFIFRDIQVTAQVDGADMVEFILKQSGDTVDSAQVYSQDETFTYNFGKPGIGFYTITADVYQNDNIICSESMDRIFSLSP